MDVRKDGRVRKNRETTEEECLEQTSLYEIEHLILRNWFYEMDPSAVRQLRGCGEQRICRLWSDFRRDSEELWAGWIDRERLSGLLIRLPRPLQQTEAWLAVMKFDSGTPQCYFTLELGEDRNSATGVLCSWSRDGTHRNHGVMLTNNPVSFLEAVEYELQASSTRNPQ
jgi:hypothetical protein